MNKINVKFTTRIYSEKTNEDLLKFTSNSNGKFDNCIFHFNKKKDSADYWVVFEELENKEFIAELNRDTILIAGEASTIKKYNQKFLIKTGGYVTR